MKPLVLFDIDGTLANCEHRLHFIHSKPRNFDAFEAAISQDTVIESVATIYRNMVATDQFDIVLLTGRSESIRPETEQWLFDNNLTGYDKLIMKTEKYQPDTIQKSNALDQVTHEYGTWPLMVFEDRARVVTMWKERGVFVINVDQNAVD